MLEIISNKKAIYFDDMAPEPKDLTELMVLVLENASGTIKNISKYNDEEITLCVRELITRGYLRGTIISRDKCSWSRLTRRGSYYLELLKSNNSI
jgi:hypothetical protein